MTAIPTLLLAAIAAAPQDPAEVLARYTLAGRPAAVTRTDVAVEMAFHLRRQELGVQACEVLVDAAIARKLATAKKLMPSDDEARQFWTDLQKELRAAGQRPEDFAAVRNTGEADWLRYLAVQMAQERLVRAELGLDAKEKVSGDMIRLWQQESRRKAKIVIDPDALPVGVAAQVDGETIAMIELGLLLLRTSEDHEREKFINQVVYLQALDALAHDHGIEPSAVDLDRAIAARAADAASDPRYRGLSFEQLLKSQGMTPATLKQARVFRAKVQLQQLAAKLHPDASLRSELAESRPAVLELVGPRRRISMIFVRALDEPNALVPVDFAAALQKLSRVRERLAKESFEVVARSEDQEPAIKARGGDLGWHTRRSEDIPEIVLASAFSLPRGAVSEPLRGNDGCYLVKTTDIEPDLGDDELVARLLEQRAQEISQRVLADAKLEIVSDRATPEQRK